ncbi:MAG: GNAT family N-acetyltransferase [Clostridia bacterium]|nr:GNAT family N-acetyltransferase [Clostridia bacterium]
MAETKQSLLSWLLPASLPGTPQEYFARLPVIDTPRLTLRRLTMRDAQDIYAYSQDPEVARHVLWDAHRSIWDTRAYLRFILRQYRLGEPSSWGIVARDTGRVIGTIGYMWYSVDNSTVELGYSLARERWNQGLMTEALNAVLAETFGVLRLHRVEAQHFSENPSSGRVMEKCGMIHEGSHRQRIYNKGDFRDVELWAILRRDWEKLHPPEK